MSSLRDLHPHALRCCTLAALTGSIAACTSASAQPTLSLRVDWITHAQFEAARYGRTRDIVATATLSMRLDGTPRNRALLEPSVPALPELITDCELEHHALCAWAREAEDAAWIGWLQAREAAR